MTDERKCPMCQGEMAEWVCIQEGREFGLHTLRCKCGHEEKVEPEIVKERGAMRPEPDIRYRLGQLKACLKVLDENNGPVATRQQYELLIDELELILEVRT